MCKFFSINTSTRQEGSILSLPSFNSLFFLSITLDTCGEMENLCVEVISNEPCNSRFLFLKNFLSFQILLKLYFQYAFLRYVVWVVNLNMVDLLILALNGHLNFLKYFLFRAILTNLIFKVGRLRLGLVSQMRYFYLIWSCMDEIIWLIKQYFSIRISSLSFENIH